MKHIVTLILIAAFCYAILMLIRNEWVARKRLWLIDNKWQEYERGDYLGYDQMLHRFWIWDIEKLRKP